MVESPAVQVHLHVGVDQFADVRAGGPVNHLRIGTARDHDPHVDPAQRSHFDRRQNRLVRKEIGRRNIDMVLRMRDGREKRLHDRRPVGIGSGRGDLDHRLLLDMRFGQVFRIVVQQLLADEKPVGDEYDLQHADRFALEPQVGIAPRPHFRPGDVPLGDVDPAREPDLAVHNQDLAVIPVINMAGQPRENHLHETLYPDAGLAQPADVLAPESPTAHVVVDQPHFDSLLRLGDQNVGDLAAQRIVLDDVIFQMDRRTGRPQRLADFVERLRSVVQQLHPVMHRQQRLVAVEQQRNDIAVVADLRFVQHRGVVDLVDLLPAQRVDLFEIAQFLAAEQF